MTALWLSPLAGLAGCAAPPPVPIVFAEITDDRVPAIAQTMHNPDNGFNSGLGAAVGDVDGDGRPDVYLAGGGLYLNRADARGFRLEAAPSQVPALDVVPIGVAFADFDRDGDLDLTICGQGGVRLLENDGHGRFSDVTAAAGVGGAIKDVSLSVAWGDLDGDGWLDLAVANYGFPMQPGNDAQPSRVYLNRRDGTLREFAGAFSQPDLYRRAWVIAFADLDGDGALDLYISDDHDVPFFDRPRARHDLVLLNRGLDASGQLTLVESSAALGLAEPHATMGVAVGNSARGPGWDLFFADINASWLDRTAGAGQPYRDVTADSGINLMSPPMEQWWMWGGAFADLDGDGFEDLLVGQSPIHTGQSGTETNGPVLLRNRGGQFALTRYAFGGAMNGRALVLVDLDGDGDQDVIVAPFFERFRFFANQTAPRRFVRVELAATVSAPGAIGAVVTARSGGAAQKRMRVAGGQPYSTSEAIVDLALASAGSAELTVTWPSGAVQSTPAVAAGTRIQISEPAWIKLDNPRPLAAVTHVLATVDARAAGLGGAQSRVHWSSPGVSLDAICDASGIATFDLPPRATAGPAAATITIDGRAVPAHPALDYH